VRIFEKRFLRRIFGPKRDEGTGEWRRLPSLELNAAYSSPNIFRAIKSRRMSWVGYVCFGGDLREKLRRRLEYNIKMVLREVRWGGIDRIVLAEDMDRCRAILNTVMKFQVP
jgi:hypothetical protein